MKKIPVKDLIDVVSVPFLDIRPSDVLFLKSFFPGCNGFGGVTF